jgi:outer membrane protein assembly factor BamB
VITSLTAGTIVVADPGAFGGGGGLIAVDPVSGRQTALARGGDFVDPSGVAITADGTIVVSDLSAFGDGGLIAVNPGTGQQTKVSSSTVFFRPMGIVADGSGQVVVAYLGQPGGVDGKVMRVSPVNGQFHAVAPTVQFLTPAGVAVDQGGNVFVADIDISGNDSRLHRIGAGGSDTIVAHGIPPGAQYTGITVEADGRILVVSQTAGSAGSVLRFGPGGGTPAIVTHGDKLVDPFGVAVGSDGAILAVDGENGVIRIEGQTQTTVSAGGSFARPLALTVAR